MRDRNPRLRALGRALARGRVVPGSDLDLVFRIAETVLRDVSGAGSPVTSADAYTPAVGGGEDGVSRRRRRRYDSSSR